MNKKLTKLLSVFIIAGAIGTGSAVGLTGCKEEHKHEAAAEWTSDETNHWHNCTADDGERLDLGEHEYDNAADADCNVCGYERVVNIAVTGISLDKTTATLKLGETTTVTLTATVTPSNATNKNVTWKTSNAEVATVANGVVTAVAQGTATITATTVDGAKTATCEITVQAASQTPENPDTPVNPPAKQEYTITFNANGHGTAPEAVTTVDGKATKPADLTDADYDFGGWYLTAECDGEAVDFTTKVFEADTTVYAKWTAKQTENPDTPVNPPAKQEYTITFNANGHGTAPEAVTTVDGKATKPADLTDADYDFGGWYLTAECDGEPVDFTTKVFEVDTTVYAKWTAKQTENPEPEPPVVNKYTVTWKNHDGTVLETDTEVVEGTIPTYDGATPVKEGDAQYSYTFKGWNKEVVAVTGDVEYIAEFEQSVNKYTVTWKNYDGTVLETDSEVPYGAIPTYDGTTPTRVEDGKNYSFSGWDKEVVAVTGDVEYVANFELLSEGQFAITYNINGHGSAIANGKTNEGKLVGEVPTLQAAGYTFGGWYLTAECDGEAVDFTTKVFEANTTVYAKWTVVPYTITYTGADGISHENPTTYTVESEEITLADLTKDYYDFLGWYNGNEKVTKIATGSTGDITLTAKWQATEYAITYEGLEGATHENPATYTIESEEISIKDPSSRDGYSFKGWTIEVDGAPTAFTKIAAGSHGNITITATWAQKVILTIADKDGKTIDTYNYEKGDRVTTEVINEKAAPAAGYEIYKIYSDFEKGEEYEVGTIEQDTTIVVTYKLTAAAIEEAIQETAKMQRVTVTTSMDGVSLTVFESDGTIVFDGISGSSETYRVYKQDNSYTEYFHANGSNDWYKREVTATEGETYATYVAKFVGEQVCKPASIIAMSETMAFDDKTDCYYIVQPASEETLKLPTRLGMFIKDGLVAGYEEVLYQGEVETRGTITIEEKATAESVQLPEAKEYTKFVQLAGSENLIIYEDFSDYTEDSTLEKFSAYGSKGVYYNSGNSETHYVKVVNGVATQVDGGAGETKTVIDLGAGAAGVLKGTVEVCFTYKFENAGNSWTLIRIVGTSKIKTKNDEVFGLRIEGSKIKYRLDGGEAKDAETEISIDSNAHEIDIKFDTDTSKLTITIDGKPIVTELQTEIKGIVAVEAVSANSDAKLIHVDNIAVIAQQKTAAEYYETAIANFQKEFESKYILEPVYELEENGEIKKDENGNPIELKKATHSIQKDYITKTHNEQLENLSSWQNSERPAVEMIVSMDACLALYATIFETDEVVIAARDAAIKQVEDLAANYTITLSDYANKESYETKLNDLKEALNDTTRCYRTMDIQSVLENTLSWISNISTDAQTIATLKSTAITEITEYRADEIEALQNADAKANIANTKGEAITTLENISGETSDAIITAINAHYAEVKAALDKAIASADDTADKHKEAYKAELTEYGQTYSSEGVDALVTAGCSAIDAVEDSAPATAAEAVLNEHKDIIYKAYATRLYNEYVEAENAKVHANDPSIGLETHAPEVPKFADCSGENAINEALENAKTAYTEFVNDVLAATEYTITFGEGESAQTKTVKYGKVVSADGIADPTAGDYTKILKGWLKEGAVYDFSTPVYGNFTLTANIVDAIKVTPAGNAFSWAAIDVNKLDTKDTDGKQDQAKPVMEGVNAFITPGDGLRYRTATDKDKEHVAGGVVQGLKDQTAFSVTYESAGTLVLKIRGGGNSAKTKITVVDVNGDVVGSYDLSEGSKDYVPVTINIPKAGTYSVNVSTGVCRFASIVQTQEAYKVEKILVSSVEVSGENRVELGASTTLTATINPDNASIKDVTWSITEGGEYASIDQNGNLTANEVGTVKVVATVDGTASTAFTVEVYKNAVTSVTITRQDGVEIEDNKITLSTGTVQLVGAVNADATIKGVTWSIPEGTDCITITEDGLITYVKPGSAVVTVTAVDNSEITATITIECTDVAVESVAFDEGLADTVNIGETITLTAKALAAEGGIPTETDLTWESSDTTKATVENGMVTGKAEGSVTITVKSVKYVDDETTPNLKATMTITINKVAVTGVALDKQTLSLQLGVLEEGQLNAIFTPANATNQKVTWSSNNEEVATVNDGVVTAKGAGEATITITTEDGSFTATCTVSVAAAPTEKTEEIVFNTANSSKLTLTADGKTENKKDFYTGVSFSVCIDNDASIAGDSDDAKSVDGKTFSEGLLPSVNKKTYTINAKEEVTLDIYFTVTDGKWKGKTADLNISGAKKSEGDTSITAKDTKTAYKVTVTIASGEKATITASEGRIALYAIYATYTPSAT